LKIGPVPTLQSLLVSSALRRFVKDKNRGELDVAYVRTWVNRLLSLPWPNPKVTISPFEQDGMRGEWLRAPEPGPRTVLYLHGGGYFFCSPRTHRPVTIGLTRLLRSNTLALKYRLAPENPYPAALDDALAAYRWLLSDGMRGEQIVLAGDSAGGGLALALMVTLRDRGLPLPAACACFSPWTDLAATGESVDRNDRNCAMFSAHMLRTAPQLYLGKTDPTCPLASPLYADLRGLPPLLIHVSDSETLLDDSTRLATRARAAGVDVELKIWARQPHVWQLFSRLIPEGRASLRETSQFLSRHLSPLGDDLDLPFGMP
jgi:monoterpene epsilon-lactone hydrolase